jgi:hypothetical protein
LLILQLISSKRPALVAVVDHPLEIAGVAVPNRPLA